MSDRRRRMMGQSKRRLPPEFEEVKYLESSEYQYIDTGIVPKNTVHLRFKATTLVFTNCIPFGVRTTGDYARSPDQIYLNLYSDYRFHLYMGRNKKDYPATIGQIVEDDISFTISPNIYTMFLFAMNRIGVLTFGGRHKIYYFEIVDHINLIPAIRKSDNKPCMFDLATMTPFFNDGTGEFGYEKMDGTYVAPI